MAVISGTVYPFYFVHIFSQSSGWKAVSVKSRGGIRYHNQAPSASVSNGHTRREAVWLALVFVVLEWPLPMDLYRYDVMGEG